jgi:hypothetical protein
MEEHGDLISAPEELSRWFHIEFLTGVFKVPLTGVSEHNIFKLDCTIYIGIDPQPRRTLLSNQRAIKLPSRNEIICKMSGAWVPGSPRLDRNSESLGACSLILLKPPESDRPYRL